MSSIGSFRDLGVTLEEGNIAVVEIQRPPHNFFDVDLINAIADAYEALDEHPECRAIVLAAAGKELLRGRELPGRRGRRPATGPASSGSSGGGHLYRHAVRIFRAKTPVVAAVQGAAIGGGLGLAVSADFRVTCPEGTLQRELHPPRVPPRVRPHDHPAGDHRTATGRPHVLHRPARQG